MIKMAKKADVNWELVGIVIALAVLALAIFIYVASKGKISNIFDKLKDIFTFGGA